MLITLCCMLARAVLDNVVTSVVSNICLNIDVIRGMLNLWLSWTVASGC
jgi:hypothetical protein